MTMSFNTLQTKYIWFLRYVSFETSFLSIIGMKRLHYGIQTLQNYSKNLLRGKKIHEKGSFNELLNIPFYKKINAFQLFLELITVVEFPAFLLRSDIKECSKLLILRITDVLCKLWILYHTTSADHFSLSQNLANFFSRI